MAKRSTPRRTGAFTLLELMLAMIIAVVLASVLYASLRIGFQAREIATEVVEPIATMRIAGDLIRQDLSGIQPPNGVFASIFNGEDEQAGAYDRDVLNYFTNSSNNVRANGLGEIVEVRLHVVDADEDTDGEFLDRTAGESSATIEAGFDLVRDVTTNLLAANTPTVTRQVIARQVVGFNARYFDGEQWKDQWNSSEYEDTLPAAIEVTLKMVPEGLTLQEAEDQEALLTSRRTWPLLMGKTVTERDQEAAE